MTRSLRHEQSAGMQHAWHIAGSEYAIFWAGSHSRLYLLHKPSGALTSIDDSRYDGPWDDLKDAAAAARGFVAIAFGK